MRMRTMLKNCNNSFLMEADRFSGVESVRDPNHIPMSKESPKKIGYPQTHSHDEGQKGPAAILVW